MTRPLGRAYGRALHDAYARGRGLAPDVMRMWMDVATELVPPVAVSRVLDLGAGTGRFSSWLAGAFDARVLAVDPSPEMLRQAEGRIARAVAVAEHLPVADRSLDLVFASMVLHHVDDLGAAGGEIARALRPNGSLLVRSNFADDVDAPYHRYFPGVLQIERDMLPTREHVGRTLAEVGLVEIDARKVRQRMNVGLRDYADRMRQRAMSPLRLIGDQAFAEGMAALDAAAEAEVDPAPVHEVIDLVLFRRRPDD